MSKEEKKKVVTKFDVAAERFCPCRGQVKYREADPPTVCAKCETAFQKR